MKSVEEFIIFIKDYVKCNPSLSEIEIIRYVYISLGSILSFDENFKPFGNSRLRNNIYKYRSRSRKDLDVCMKNRKVICKSLSYIFEIVLKELGINAKTITEDTKYLNFPHVYNRIYLKNESVIVCDLQEDLYNIQSRYYTKNFAVDSIYDLNPVIDRCDIENIDRKIGYIDDNNYYADEYLYLMHSIVDGINDVEEKLDFILNNININDISNMGYIDMQWHHKKILEEFFTSKEFSYLSDRGMIKMIDTFRYKGTNKDGLNVISLYHNNKTIIYVYNKVKNKYSKMDLYHFANAVRNGLVVYKTNVPGLVRELRKKGN